VKHKVLNMTLNGYDRTFLPHCVFTCPSLEELTLRFKGASGGPHVLPATINLPKLRKLSFGDVENSQISLDQIIAQSPKLEDLKLRDCAAYFDIVDSKLLKSLTLRDLIT
jgi:hypothetical protein